MNKQKEIIKLLESEGWQIIKEEIQSSFDSLSSSLALDDLTPEQIIESRSLCKAYSDMLEYPNKVLQRFQEVKDVSQDVYE